MSNSFATPWTVAHQAPLTVEFPSQESFLLQGISLTQGLNAGLLHQQVNSLPLVTREAHRAFWATTKKE